MEDKLGRNTGKQELPACPQIHHPVATQLETTFLSKTATTMSDFETETRDNLKQ